VRYNWRDFWRKPIQREQSMRLQPLSKYLPGSDPDQLPGVLSLPDAQRVDLALLASLGVLRLIANQEASICYET
jgi:hypothetical protein